MRLLLVGGSTETKRILNTLLRKSGHILEWRDSAECHSADLTEYDILLVDASFNACEEEPCLRDLLRKVRGRFPQVKIVVLNVLGALTNAEDYATAHHNACGAIKSGDGMWQLRCRLHELARREAQALLLDAIARPACEPITFEYQG